MKEGDCDGDMNAEAGDDSKMKLLKNWEHLSGMNKNSNSLLMYVVKEDYFWLSPVLRTN